MPEWGTFSPGLNTSPTLAMRLLFYSGLGLSKKMQQHGISPLPSDAAKAKRNHNILGLVASREYPYLTIVEAVCLFIQISEEVKRLYANVCS